MSVAAYIEELARRIDLAWAAAQYRQRAFPELAAAALQELPAHGEIGVEKLVHAVLERDALASTGAHAADTVVPLFAAPRFTISAHFWIDEIGHPHGHRWNGAFQIATGTVCHAHFDFTESWRHDARLRVGELRLRELGVLTPGDTVAVEAGRTIHGLCHLDRPSLSLVVRAWDEPDRVILDYWRPGLALETGWRDPQWQAMSRCIALVRRTAPERVLDLLGDVLPRLDAHGVAELLRSTLAHDPDGVLALAHDRPHCLHEHRDVLVGALEDMLRLRAFEQARASTHDLDERFVLGALYLAPSSEPIATLAARRWPDAPRELFAVVDRLARSPDDVFGLDGRDPLPDHPMLAPLSVA